MITDKMKQKQIYGVLESLYVLILGMYPLRHIYVGLDLWDTGYSYANFQYMGVEHMDPMWLFSTYLANGVGNLLMKLPAAGSLAGMNFYTALFVSALGLIGYFFCTRKLKITPFVAFIGEFVAINLCWCPTAKLYDYLTYVLYLTCVILLYLGLTQEKNRYLLIAGICLGANVLVRFSNLPEAAMIVAVWAYGVIEASDKPGAWKRTVSRTLWCLGGYLSALVVLLGYIAIRYGLDEYVTGIMRLFAMTDNATDYKATAMLAGMVNSYTREIYWVVRMMVFMLAGMCVLAGLSFFLWCCKSLAKKNEKVYKRIKMAAGIIGVTVCVAFAVAMLYWLYKNGFCSFAFYSYDAMLRPGILFLMLTMLIAVIRIFHRNSPKEEKLISGMVLLVVLITSIGSNNEVYPSINNLFVAAPYTIWQCWVFCKNIKEKNIRIGKKLEITIHPFAAKCVVTAFLAMFSFQSIMFGWTFVFVEATGARDASATVENNEILKGIQMSPERAEWMTSITAYVEENDLQGREVILYGWIPSLSYYLQMPSAFNPWSDLDSYSLEQMKQDMAELEGQITEKGAEYPVIIAEISYAQDDNTAAEQDVKWQLIVDFMEKYEYQQTFSNEKFVIWEKN